MKEYKFSIFGKQIAIKGAPGAWQAFYLGVEGKRRPADFIVPHDLEQDALCEYLADLFHEDARPGNDQAVQLG